MHVQASNWGFKGETVAPHDGMIAIFFVPAGTRCHARRVTDSRWQPYTTKRDLHFKRGQPRKIYCFRADGWELKVWHASVRPSTARRADIADL